MRLPSIPWRRPVHALAFSDSAVALMRHGADGWHAVERVALDDSRFSTKVAALPRHIAGRPAVALWLPAGHVLSLRLAGSEAPDPDAAIAARTGLKPAALTVVLRQQPATGDRILYAVDTTTLAEAIAHARAWGFAPVAATVRPEAVPPGSNPPVFAHPALDCAARRGAVAVATGCAAAAVALGIMLAWPAPRDAMVPDAAPAQVSAPAVAAEALQPVAAVWTPATATPASPSLTGAARVSLSPGDRPAAHPPAADTPRVPARAGLPARPPVPPTTRAAYAPPPALPDPIAAPPRGARPQIAALPEAGRSAARDPIPTRPAPTDEAPALGDSAPAVAAAPRLDTPASPEVMSEAVAAPPTPLAPTDAPVAAASPAEVAPTAPEPEDPAVAEALARLAAAVPAPRPERLALPALVAPRPGARPAGLAAAVRSQRAAPVPARQSEPTPASIARAATIPGALPPGEAGLLGVIGNGTQRAALLRLPDGRVTRVQRGDRVAGWTVSAIDDTSVRLSGGGGPRTLRVPRP